MVSPLAKKAIGGVKWSTSSKIIVTILQTIQILVLTRLLAPEDFGIMAIVMVAIGVCGILSDAGISKVLVINDELSLEQLSTLYWLNVLIGISLTFFLYFLSPVIALFYGERQITELLQLVSISFVSIALSNQYKMLMEKEFEFEVLAKIEVVCNAVSFVATLFLAYSGYGVYSLVYGYLITVILSSLCIITHNFHKLHLTFIFNFLSVRELLIFGLYQVGERVVNYLSSQADVLIIGKLLGVDQLGIYSIAKNLVGRPLQMIIPMINRVLLPYFSKLKGNTKLLEYNFIQVINLVSTLTFILFASLALFSEHLFSTFFIDEWQSAASIFSILCVNAMFISHASSINLLFLVKGRADIGFKWNLVMLFVIPLYIYGASLFSLHVVALSWVILRVLQFYPSWYFLVKPVSAISFYDYSQSLFRPLISIVLAMLICLVFFSWSDYEVLSLILGICGLFTGYFITLRLFNKKIYTIIYLFLTQRLKEYT